MEILLEKASQDFWISLKTVDQEQVFLTASITNEVKNPIDIYSRMYSEIVKILIEKRITILHERSFGSIQLYESINKVRSSILDQYSLDSDTPFTYIEGNPYWGEGISGINIYGVILKDESDRIRNIKHENSVCGRMWKRGDSEYLILNSIHGLNSDKDDHYTQSLGMFEKVNCILKENGFEFNNVIRTWIYLHKVLNQYDDFNRARNLKFKEYGLIPNQIDDVLFEQVYMPASTGIDCNNRFGAAGVMDVLAIKKNHNSGISIHNETGKEQKSAYRYGSAFSRAMVVQDCKSKYVYLSGTASINDKGETVYLNDIDKQIEKTIQVIEALVNKEGFDIYTMCEGTVFLKRAEYIGNFKEYCKRNNLLKMPWVITVANVCRDNLLFEIDAVFMKENN